MAKKNELKNNIFDAHLLSIAGITKGKIVDRLKVGELGNALDADKQSGNLTQGEYDELLLLLEQQAMVKGNEVNKARVLALGDLTEATAAKHGGAIGFGLITLLTTNGANVTSGDTRRHKDTSYVCTMLATVAACRAGLGITAEDHLAVAAWSDEQRILKVAPTQKSLKEAITEARRERLEQQEILKAEAEAKASDTADEDSDEDSDDADDADAVDAVEALRNFLMSKGYDVPAESYAAMISWSEEMQIAESVADAVAA